MLDVIFEQLQKEMFQMGKLRTNLSGVDDKEDLIRNLTKSTLCVPRNKVKQTSSKNKSSFKGTRNKRMANKKGKMKMKVINTNTNE